MVPTLWSDAARACAWTCIDVILMEGAGVLLSGSA